MKYPKNSYMGDLAAPEKDHPWSDKAKPLPVKPNPLDGMVDPRPPVEPIANQVQRMFVGVPKRPPMYERESDPERRRIAARVAQEAARGGWDVERQVKLALQDHEDAKRAGGPS